MQKPLGFVYGPIGMVQFLGEVKRAGGPVVVHHPAAPISCAAFGHVPVKEFIVIIAGASAFRKNHFFKAKPLAEGKLMHAPPHPTGLKSAIPEGRGHGMFHGPFGLAVCQGPMGRRKLP